MCAVAVSCGMASGKSGAELISTSACQRWSESGGDIKPYVQ